ncbi:hypothetical protein WG66_008430 [Moniliophthora roreri]|nr:hypothetical protein WG66_008430 [Moniliophthora roreri]
MNTRKTRTTEPSDSTPISTYGRPIVQGFDSTTTSRRLKDQDQFEGGVENPFKDTCQVFIRTASRAVFCTSTL